MAPRGRPKQLDGDTRVVSVRITNNVYENIKARGDDMSTTLREIIEAGTSVNKNLAAPAPSSPTTSGELPPDEIAALEVKLPEAVIRRRNERLRRLAIANRDLRRQLAAMGTPPAAPAPSPIDVLSPAARAEFDRIVAIGGLERLLLKVAEKRSAPAPEPIDFPMPEIPEVVETPVVEPSN